MPTLPALPNNEYAVGIITALPLELTAARACLDEVHGKPHWKNPSDTNTYSLGRIGDHKVVLACLPTGVYGTTSAAIVASQMLSSFPSIRFGLMVGIGGGAPGEKHDIRLGDIVVSEPSGQYSGVVQYDLGKRTATGFQLKGCLNKPPQVLLNAVARLKSDAMMGMDDIGTYLSEIVTKYPSMKTKFSYQDAENDRLFQPDHLHVPGETSCDAGVVRVVDREPRPDTRPRVHYGLVASGNSLMKDSVTRDELAQSYGVLCFEMEAAGLMDNFPCLVIRGICDYSDSHKNDLWQEYAAATAAAYAKNLLSLMDGSDVSKTEEAVKVVDQLAELQTTSKKILEAEKERIQQERKQNERRVHGMFKTSNYEAHKARNPPRVNGTCGWFLKHKHYLEWRDSRADALLWVSADPGCGKSVLAKSLIENELASNSRLSTCYFFFKDDNKEQQSVSTALCALLHQLHTQRPPLLSKEADLVLREGQDLHQDFHALWRILIRAASRPEAGNVICILDALDEGEASQVSSLIESLNRFQQKARDDLDTRRRRNSLKFLVTSRPYFSIQSRFQETIAYFPTIHLSGENESATIEEEISLVIKSRVPQIAARLRLDAAVRDALQERLLQIPHRTYLWLHLMFEELQSSLDRTEKKLTNLLNTIPRTVDEAYEKILQRSIRKRDARKILHAVLAAQRPLTIGEMNVILALEDETEAYADLDLENNDHIGEKIRNICGLFISISQSKVYLCHQTAREFLLRQTGGRTQGSIRSLSFKWRHTFDLQDSNMILARICIAFLFLKDFYQDSVIWLPPRARAMTDWVEFTERFEFLYYASIYWPAHFFRVQQDCRRPMLPLVHKLCETQRLRYCIWYPIYWRLMLEHVITGYCNEQRWRLENDHEKIKFQLRSMPSVTGLTFITTFGCVELVQFFLSRGADINERVVYFGCALTTATICGHQQIVSLLLRNHATLDGHAHDHGTALHVAACMGNKPMVELLISQGANINDSRGVHGTPLLASLSGGHNSIAEFLVQRRADVRGKDMEGKNALFKACAIGNLAVVQAVLQKGAVEQIGEALQQALSKGHSSIARVLIEQNVDIGTEAGLYTVTMRERQRKVISEWHARHGVPMKEHRALPQKTTSRRFTAPLVPDDCGPFIGWTEPS